MDTLRGNFEALDDSHGIEPGEDESGRDAPPPSIGQDERRMQVRAYNHWASLLEDRNFPAIDHLEPDNLPDFGPYSVLLDFTGDIENPGITYLGGELAKECDISTSDLKTLADVPSRSLLSRITDHYMQILANQAPIGFEAEFVNQRGSTILYRGILLPFSTDDEAIDFIYGVINWKELADQHTSDELLLQVDQALESRPEGLPKRLDDTPLTDWADGPGATVANDIDDAPFELSEEEAIDLEMIEEDDLPVSYAEGLPTFSGRAEDYLDDEDIDDEADEDDEDNGLPRPKFGSLMSIGGGRAVTTHDVDETDDVELTGFAEDDDVIVASDAADFEYADDAVMALDGFEIADEEAGPVGGAIAFGSLDPAEMELGDWLAAAREMAAQARNS
ncbi:MAG: PAS domain-containing protein, partial [Croceibacterium sp.]